MFYCLNLNMRSLVFCLCVFLLGCGAKISRQIPKGRLVIEWVDYLPGDYSFKDKWDYPMGVYKNDFGQVSCDGFCPEEVYRMMDSTGRIYKDSLSSFYKYVDTTHVFHTISCDAWCYEYGETNDIKAVKGDSGKVICWTMCNAGTHCSLQLNIKGDTCFSSIDLKSIVPRMNAVYYCNGGHIKIDKGLFKNGILKAEFDIDFENKEPGEKEKMFWKGRALCQIAEKQDQ